ncbi:hypothetical protein ACFV0B_11295 [Streptomyces xanthophaeus]|uniref:hypothetical protein n=1 Tax=Streptomyces xanthophaeus TaxID=67385 RepID=UPI00368BB312
MTAPAECPDACTEHHTYSADCAAMSVDYDPNAGMRERYIAAVDQVFEKWQTGLGDTRPQDAITDAVLAARDVYLNNVRRIGKQQTTQLAELYMTTKKQAEKSERNFQITANQLEQVLRRLRGATTLLAAEGDLSRQVIEQHQEIADALEASQRRAMHIQTLLDEQRDRVRKIHKRYADGTCYADGETYPCPTITAIQPPKETPDA